MRVQDRSDVLETQIEDMKKKIGEVKDDVRYIRDEVTSARACCQTDIK